MRNRALHDRIRAFAQEAAEHLTDRVESGSEIPFEVAQSPGATSVLYRYRPLSGQFVSERFGELRGLESFGPATLALRRVEGVSAYLRVLGVSYVPTDERDRSEAVLREFLARLWDEASTFELDDQRFERTYAELESVLYENTVVTTVLAPLLGVHIADERWELGSGLALARGDLREAPPEAVWELGHERKAPNTLIVLSVEATPSEPPPLTSARLSFKKLLTTLRLFKPGAATLGPTAWWRHDDGPWQSLPLGFGGRPGGGDYRLQPTERAELAELFDVVRARPLSGGALPWALSRFELGCAQPVALDGLSDHLLALSALLDTDDASPVGISSRLAALCAEPANRKRLETRVQQAFALQRVLMRGDLDADYIDAIGSEAPDAVAHDLEDHLRAILRDMVCGYLDADVRRIADDLLQAESSARPQPKEAPPPPSRTPGSVASKLRRSLRERRPEPALESWEEVVTESTSQPAAVDPPEPQFVVRRKTKPKASAPGRASNKAVRAGTREQSSRARGDSEQATQETIAVGGVREISTEDDMVDWGFDDDPQDYSAPV